MNKKDLIDVIAQKSGVKKQEIARVIDAFIESTSEAVKTGEKITIMGFGSIFVSERAQRNGYNAAKHELSVFPPKKRIRFRPGKDFGID